MCGLTSVCCGVVWLVGNLLKGQVPIGLRMFLCKTCTTACHMEAVLVLQRRAIVNQARCQLATRL